MTPALRALPTQREIDALYTRREIALATLRQAQITGIGYREAKLTYDRIVDETVRKWSQINRADMSAYISHIGRQEA